MKTLIFIAALAAAGLSAHAQGTVSFNNRVVGVVDAPVFDVGGTVRLAGAAFFAQLYAAPAGSPDSALSPMGSPTTFRPVPPATTGQGYVVPVAEVAITGVAPGGTARVQMRAWDSTFGTYQAAVDANGKFGFSNIFDVSGLGGPPPGGGPPGTAPNLAGLTSFSLQQVPEPSTIALGALGVAALLFRRRK
jgi:hypothetical protein